MKYSLALELITNGVVEEAKVADLLQNLVGDESTPGIKKKISGGSAIGVEKKLDNGLLTVLKKPDKYLVYFDSKQKRWVLEFKDNRITFNGISNVCVNEEYLKGKLLIAIKPKDEVYECDCSYFEVDSCKYLSKQKALLNTSGNAKYGITPDLGGSEEVDGNEVDLLIKAFIDDANVFALSLQDDKMSRKRQQ